MSAHFIPPEPAAIADVRRDLEALVGRASLPADPQTARSIGMGPAWVDLADAVDLASLAAGQRRHAYRMAADAVDHLIALMDALEADTEDMETVNEDGDPLDIGEADDADREPSLGAPENHPAQWHIDMADRYHTGLRHHPARRPNKLGCWRIGRRRRRRRRSRARARVRSSVRRRRTRRSG